MDAVARSTKRMRVGTRSCAECRRRKVRCTFVDGQERCRQCQVHNATCLAQEPADLDLGAGGTTGSAELVKRLERTEDTLRMLVDAINKQPAGGANVPLSSLGVISPQSSDEGTETVRREDVAGLDQSTIVQLLRSSLSAQRDNDRDSASRARDVQPALASIAHLVPDKSCLWCILQATQRFWCIWPLANTTTERGELCFPTDAPSGVAFIYDSFNSSEGGVAAKALVWLCLCIQQLPKNFEQMTCPLPLRAGNLVDAYLEKVDSIVLGPSESACNYDCIEAMLLQYKVFINMGRPQRSWRCTRSALDHAIILGCHRKDGGVSSRAKQLWNALWQHDRHLSLFLGLPYSVPEHYISHPGEKDDITLEERVMHHMNIICGHITDRDLLGHESFFSSTAKIVEEMEKLKSLIPEDWNETTVTNTDLPGGVAFWRTAIVLLINCTDQWIHLPYVLERRGGDRHAYSRSVALKAAKKTLLAWQGIRALDGVPLICDFLDFCAFTAALVLATDLLLEETQRSADETYELWNLISSLTGDMKQTARVLDCPVASQSAEVLEHLIAARHGTYQGPETYEVTIPCFGKMRIRRPGKPGRNGDAPSSHRVPEAASVEFNSNIFSFRAPAEFQTLYELGENWSAGGDFDATYEWNELFNFH